MPEIIFEAIGTWNQRILLVDISEIEKKIKDPFDHLPHTNPPPTHPQTRSLGDRW